MAGTHTGLLIDDAVNGALRRAIVMGLNTPDLINVWYQGQAVPATQPIPPNVAGHTPDFNVGVKYDPATARQLLDGHDFRVRHGDEDGGAVGRDVST